MMIATRDGIRDAQPEPRGRAACPLCSAAVVAKCGRIVVWHWAHESKTDCDPWAETPGPWHRQWQESVSLGQREVVIGAHRADIVSPSGYVIELQDSVISPDEIAEREHYYAAHTPGMVWVFNVAEAFKSDRLDLRAKQAHCPECGAAARPVNRGGSIWRCDGTETFIEDQNINGMSFGKTINGPRHTFFDQATASDPYRTLRWKHPRKSLAFCRQPVYLDLGRDLFKVGRLHFDGGPPYGGYGWLTSKQAFQAALLSSNEVTT